MPSRDPNVIFRDESGNATDAQLLAFEDTWHWGPSAEATYAYLTNTARHEGRVPDKVSAIGIDPIRRLGLIAASPGRCQPLCGPRGRG